MFNRGGGFTLAKLCEALGWQNATIHQVVAEVRRLVALQSAMSMLEQENAQLRQRFRGCCPDAQDFETEEAYKEALTAWEGKP